MTKTPPGKKAGDENFPVASLLTPSWARARVRAFYAFARAGDDIADDPDLSEGEKIARLEALSESLTPDQRPFGRDLMAAFLQDVSVHRYESFDALLASCRLSASPVGFFFLDLYGEKDPRARDGVDALCCALQILNHVQDCGDDYRNLDRVYLPAPWFAEEGITVAALGAGQTGPALRRVLDRALDEVAGLIAAAAVLPRVLMGRRLAMEAGAFLAITGRLHHHLGRRDPLAGRVRLGPVEKAWCMAYGALSGLLAHRGVGEKSF